MHINRVLFSYHRDPRSCLLRSLARISQQTPTRASSCMIFCTILKSRCTFCFVARVQLRWCSKLLISQTPDLSSNSFTRHDLPSQARASRRAEKKFHRLGSDRAELHGMMEETGYAWGGGRGWQGRDVSRQTTRTQKPSSFGTNVRETKRSKLEGREQLTGART